MSNSTRQGSRREAEIPSEARTFLHNEGHYRVRKMRPPLDHILA